MLNLGLQDLNVFITYMIEDKLQKYFSSQTSLERETKEGDSPVDERRYSYQLGVLK